MIFQRARSGIECPWCTSPVVNVEAAHGELLSRPDLQRIDDLGQVNALCPNCYRPIRLVKAGTRYGLVTVEGHDHHYNLNPAFLREDGQRTYNAYRKNLVTKRMRMLDKRAVTELRDLSYTPKEISEKLGISLRRVRHALGKKW